MHKENWALNNLQWLIRYKTKPILIYLIYRHKEYWALNNLQWLIRYQNKPNLIKSYIFNI